MAFNAMHPPVDPMPSVPQSPESNKPAKPETNDGPTNPLDGCIFDLLLSNELPASCELEPSAKPINDQSLYLTENYTADLLHLESDLHNGFELATTIRKLKTRRPVAEKYYSKPFLNTAKVEVRPQVCRNTQKLKILVVDYNREAIREEERQRAALASTKLRKFEERKHAEADKQAEPDAFESNALDFFLKASAEKRLKKKMVMKSVSEPVSNMENTRISRRPSQNKTTSSSKHIEKDGQRKTTDPGRVETAKDEPTVATVQISTPAMLQPELADHPSAPATAIQPIKVQPESQVSDEVTPDKQLEPVVDCELEVKKVLENEAQVADCFPIPSHVTLTIELEAALAAQNAAESDEPVNPIAEEKSAVENSFDMVVDIESSTDQDMPVISNVKSNRAADNSTQNTTPSLRLSLQELMSPSSTSNSLSQAFRTMKDLEQRTTTSKYPVTEQPYSYIQKDVGTSNSSLKTAVSCPNYQLNYCVDSQLVCDKRENCPEPDDCELTIKSVMSKAVTTDADVIAARKNMKRRKPSQTRKRWSFSILTPGSPSKQKQYQPIIDEPVGEVSFRDEPIREKILEETSNQSAVFSDSSGLGLKISKPCSVVLDKSCSVINLLAENTNVKKLPKEVDEEVLKQRARVFLPHINLSSLRLLSWLYEGPEGQRHCNHLDYLDASDFLCCYDEFALTCSIHPTGSKPDVVLSKGLKYIMVLQRRVICLLVEVTSHIIKSKRLHRRKTLLEQKLKGNKKRLSGPRDEWTNALNQQESLNGKIFLTSLRSFMKFENLSPQENYIRARNTELRRDINHDLKLIEFHMDPTVEAELELKWNQAVRTKLVNAVMFTSPNRKPATFCQQELDQISMDDDILQDCILRNQKYSESLFKQREESGRNSSQISALSQEVPSGSCSEKGFTPLTKQFNASKKNVSDRIRALDVFLAQVYTAIFLNNSRSMNKACPTLQSSIPTVRTRTMTRAYNAMYMQFLRQSVKNVRVGGNAHIHIRDGKVVPDEDTSVRGIVTKAQGLVSNLKRVVQKQDDEFRQQMNRNAELKTKLANLYARVCRNGKAKNPTALKAFSLLGECSTIISEYSFSREWLDRDETPDDMKRMLVELDQIAIPDDLLADFEGCTEELSVSKPSLNDHPQNKLQETVGDSATQKQNLLTKIVEMRTQKTQKSTNVTELCSSFGSCSEPSRPHCTDTHTVTTYSQPKDITAAVKVCSQLKSIANVNTLTKDKPCHDDSDAEVELVVGETATTDKNVTNIVSVSGPYKSVVHEATDEGSDEAKSVPADSVVDDSEIIRVANRFVAIRTDRLIALAVGTDESLLVCRLCGYQNPNRKKLGNHLREHFTNYSCSACKVKGWFRREYATKHISSSKSCSFESLYEHDIRGFRRCSQEVGSTSAEFPELRKLQAEQLLSLNRDLDQIEAREAAAKAKGTRSNTEGLFWPKWVQIHLQQVREPLKAPKSTAKKPKPSVKTRLEPVPKPSRKTTPRQESQLSSRQAKKQKRANQEAREAKHNSKRHKLAKAIAAFLAPQDSLEETQSISVASGGRTSRVVSATPATSTNPLGLSPTPQRQVAQLPSLPVVQPDLTLPTTRARLIEVGALELAILGIQQRNATSNDIFVAVGQIRRLLQGVGENQVTDSRTYLRALMELELSIGRFQLDHLTVDPLFEDLANLRDQIRQIYQVLPHQE